ncbi:MAG: hypothetical protein DHS20C21_01520 [Gemmatimonadota bacterium]|nr:MAG: hypothetical protein DHS20C21_01520 [Gemmatimonadota bacterium]
MRHTTSRVPGALAGGIGVASLVATLLLAGTAVAKDYSNTEDELPFRVDEFAGWFHDAGNVLLHVSNRGLFGRAGSDLTNPSAEWPAGSNHEYLYGAGIWVGGVVTRNGIQDTLVTAGLYQQGELRNWNPNEGCGNPPEGICKTFEGAPSGIRRFDDDGDGLVDEDPLDGKDDDGDGRIDEDFAGISQQMFRTVYYDTSTRFNQFFSDEADRHTPLGLKITQESYVWTDPQFDDFVGVEFKVKNISTSIDPIGWDINNCYIGFMVDGDVGIDDTDLDYWTDDQGAFEDTTVVLESTDPNVPARSLHLTMGYIFDELGGENGADDVPGYCGVMFLGHTVDTTSATPSEALAPREVGIHAYRVWSGGDDDPRDDLDRYRFLRGNGDTSRTIDPPTARANDYRFLVSAGPFSKIPPGSTLTFQVAFVMGEMVERTVGDFTIRAPDVTNPSQAQLVYDGFIDEVTGERINWATSSPPPPPNIRVRAGDKHVKVEWDDFPEGVADPLTQVKDFAGYQIWKAEGWRRDSIIPSDDMWRLIADFDSTELADVDTGHSGVGRYRFVDNRVKNGFWYWYAVSAYDKGVFSMRVVMDSTTSEPDTIYTRVGEPKFGKFTQNMTRVMPQTTSTQTLADVYVVPNPYRVSAAWDLAETNVEPTGRRLKFFNLPSQATIRIFSLAGDLVAELNHDDTRLEPGNDRGQTSWNLISRNNQDTVSGVYLYHVESALDGSNKVGKFVIIR